ncbi:unnamed protein product [Choristocarpus tenellus]
MGCNFGRFFGEENWECSIPISLCNLQSPFFFISLHSSSSGEPTVLKLYPLAVSPKGVRAGNTERQPFPTMYWLSCPALKATISHLEKNGLVVEWEKRLQGNQESLIAMEKAHKEYAEERWSMLTDEDMAIVRRNRWDQALGLTSGVAGINKPATIKCLHTHFAHFLATGENLVGKWVHDALVARAEGGAATGGEGAEGSSTRP